MCSVHDRCLLPCSMTSVYSTHMREICSQLCSVTCVNVCVLDCRIGLPLLSVGSVGCALSPDRFMPSRSGVTSATSASLRISAQPSQQHNNRVCSMTSNYPQHRNIPRRKQYSIPRDIVCKGKCSFNGKIPRQDTFMSGDFHCERIIFQVKGNIP